MRLSLTMCGSWLLLIAGATGSGVQFADATKASGIAFTHRNSATSNKYLVETMGGGVALLDYDNDGRLDIFLTNGAKIDDPMPDGNDSLTRPTRTFWNRLYHQTADGTFVDVTREGAASPACRRTATAWAWRSATTTTTASTISTSRTTAATRCITTTATARSPT